MRPIDQAFETNVGADYTDDEREFLVAIEQYRQSRHRRFPTCREILEVVKSLGYEKSGTGQTTNRALPPPLISKV